MRVGKKTREQSHRQKFNRISFADDDDDILPHTLTIRQV